MRRTAEAATLHGDVVDVPDVSVGVALLTVCRATPDRIALTGDGVRLTFAQLWDAAGKVAHTLRELGVRPGDRALVAAETGPDAVLALVGCLVAGVSFVPLDPRSPAARVADVAATARPLACLTAGAAPRWPDLGIPTVAVSEALAATAPAAEPVRDPGAEAYAIFTSGTTGRPKGVPVTHRSLLNYSAWCAGTLLGTGGSPLFGSLAFDLAMTSLWPALLSGQTVEVFDGPWAAKEIFASRDVPYGLVKMTPSHLDFFARTGAPAYARSTRTLVLGGEQLLGGYLREVADQLAGVRLVNHYGPTETTIGCCATVLDGTGYPADAPVPIGRPIWNTRAYVLDDRLRPVPPGGEGELVIAGAGVSAGYLGGPADRHVEEAELGGPAGVAFRTGDQVRLDPHGDLVCLGRLDDQVKVNGHRVEPGEVRAACLALPEVRDAVARVVGAGRVRELEVLVVPAEPPADPARYARGVLRGLAGRLPASSMPRRAVPVGRVELTGNGKLDVDATLRTRL